MIQEFKFGSFVIDGKRYVDDIKIIDKKVKGWSNRQKHDLRTEDVRDIIMAKPEILVIGLGASGLLQISDDVRREIAMKGIRIVSEKTPKACDIYNRALLDNKRVAAIFHGTC